MYVKGERIQPYGMNVLPVKCKEMYLLVPRQQFRRCVFASQIDCKLMVYMSKNMFDV